MFDSLQRLAPLADPHDRAIFGVTLGGPDRKTLFLLAAEWRGREHVDEAVAARTGQVLVSQVSVPGAGWP